MPIISSKYKSPFILKSGDLQSILASIYTPKVKVQYTRERIATHDGDFLDLDWSLVGSNRLAIITHGLEGSSQSTHILRIVQTLNDEKWDCLAWNMRGCSGEPNLQLRTYHSGFTEDLTTVFSEALFKKRYQEIILVGFSAGGNMTLKFLGEQSAEVSTLIRAAITFSVPTCLTSTAKNLASFRNKIYMNHFLGRLKGKLELKEKTFDLNLKNLKKLKNFFDYDTLFTAPLFGYKSAEELWTKNSSKLYLKNIKVPTLIINAADDPILGRDCYPLEEAKNSEYVFLELPKNGGHNGFFGNNYYPGKRVIEFINTFC